MKVQWGVTIGTEAEFLTAAGAGWQPAKGQICWETDKQRVTFGETGKTWAQLTHYSLGAAAGMNEAKAKELFLQKTFIADWKIIGAAPKRTQSPVAISGVEGFWASEAEAVTGTITGGIECKLNAATHAGKIVEITSASEIKVKVESTAGFEAGMFVGLWQGGAGKLVVEGVGVNLRNSGTSPIQSRQINSELGIRFRSGTDAVITGDQV